MTRILVALAVASTALAFGGARAQAAANPTRLALRCAEEAVVVNARVTCTASVTDTGPAPSRIVPTGVVSFSSDGAGAFSPAASCTLEPSGAFSGRCVVAYMPTRIGSGTHTISASYGGDAGHGLATTKVELGVTPTNDDRRAAERLAVPGRTTGTTAGATYEDADPETCEGTEGLVWYRLAANVGGRIAVRLAARGDLDAVVAVFRRARSRLRSITCAPSDNRGVAGLSFAATGGVTYLVGVGSREGSPPGTFELSAKRLAPVALPGPTLGRGLAQVTLDPLSRPAQAWSVMLEAGTSYRLSVVSSGGCVVVSLLRPPARTSSLAIRRLSCGGYFLFTPGPDSGGRYALLVEAAGSGTRRVHVAVARAGIDDTAPGLPLASGTAVRGRLDAATGDAVDLYRIEIADRGDVLLHLSSASSFDLVLVSEAGGRQACGCGGGRRADIRRQLDPGVYFVAVRSRNGASGAYVLSLLVRGLTSTRLSVSGAGGHVPVGSGVSVVATVSPTPQDAGTVQIVIERFDPLSGWQFSRRLVAQLAGGVARATWVPASVGRWRLRAVFPGTHASSPSGTGWVVVSAVT